MIFAFRVVDFWKKTLFGIMLWYFQQTHCLGGKKINNCFFLFFQLILQEDKKQVSNEEIKYETPQLFFLNVNSMIIMRSWSILKYFSFGMHEDEVGLLDTDQLWVLPLVLYQSVLLLPLTHRPNESNIETFYWTVCLLVCGSSPCI